MKKLFVVILILIGAGIWVGINFAKDRPLLSNPFTDSDISERASEAAGSAAKRVLQEGQRQIERVER